MCITFIGFEYLLPVRYNYDGTVSFRVAHKIIIYVIRTVWVLDLETTWTHPFGAGFSKLNIPRDVFIVS